MSEPTLRKANFTGARSIPANWCNLRHTNEEFIFDFGMTAIEPEAMPPIVDTSVVLSYFMAKRFFSSLGLMIKNWEDNYGEIEIEAANRLIAREPQPLQTAEQARQEPQEARTLTKIQPPVPGQPPAQRTFHPFDPQRPPTDAIPIEQQSVDKPPLAAGTTVDVLARPITRYNEYQQPANSPPIENSPLNPAGMPDQDGP